MNKNTLPKAIKAFALVTILCVFCHFSYLFGYNNGWDKGFDYWDSFVKKNSTQQCYFHMMLKGGY